MIQKTQAYREAKSKFVTELWKDPEYRAKVISAQRAKGLRSYKT